MLTILNNVRKIIFGKPNKVQLLINIVLLFSTVLFAARATINNSKFIESQYNVRAMSSTIAELHGATEAQDKVISYIRKQNKKDYKHVIALFRNQAEALEDVEEIKSQLDRMEATNEEIKTLFNSIVPDSVIQLLNEQANSVNGEGSENSKSDSSR